MYNKAPAGRGHPARDLYTLCLCVGGIQKVPVGLVDTQHRTCLHKHLHFFVFVCALCVVVYWWWWWWWVEKAHAGTWTPNMGLVRTEINVSPPPKQKK